LSAAVLPHRRVLSVLLQRWTDPFHKNVKYIGSFLKIYQGTRNTSPIEIRSRPNFIQAKPRDNEIKRMLNVPKTMSIEFWNNKCTPSPIHSSPTIIIASNDIGGVAKSIVTKKRRKSALASDK
jgi:hypothetical protein